MVYATNFFIVGSWVDEPVNIVSLISVAQNSIAQVVILIVLISQFNISILRVFSEFVYDQFFFFLASNHVPPAEKDKVLPKRQVFLKFKYVNPLMTGYF